MAAVETGHKSTPHTGTDQISDSSRASSRDGGALEPVETRDIVYPNAAKTAVIMLCLYLSMFLVALDRTIIATAIPRITDDFHSIDVSNPRILRLPPIQRTDNCRTLAGMVPHIFLRLVASSSSMADFTPSSLRNGSSSLGLPFSRSALRFAVLLLVQLRSSLAEPLLALAPPESSRVLLPS
jgi:hypothetical protein